MNHGEYKEWISLLLYDELANRERALLEEHLKVCDECRGELSDLQAFHSFLNRHQPVQPSGQTLAEARRQLRSAINREHSPPAAAAFAGVRLFPRLTLTAAAALAVGFFLGFLFFQSYSQRGPAGHAPGEDLLSRGNLEIANIRFIDADAGDGEIEFSFEAVLPMRVRGPLSDKQVQKILAHALVYERNPGVRLRAVAALGNYPAATPDPQIKEALLTALQSDLNPGVRKQALEVLRKLPFDEEIKETFLFVLTHDENSGLRIAAIKGLEAARFQKEAVDAEMLRVLRQSMSSDENDYVRIRSRAFLEEIKQ